MPMGGRKEVGRPLPDVAGHVVEAVPVRPEALDRRGALEAVEQGVLPGELALPGVCHQLALGRELVTPAIDLPFEPSARGVLPFRFGREVLAGPGGVGASVFEGDVGDGVQLASVKRAAGAFRVLPVGAGYPRPPVADVGEVDRTCAAREHEGSRHEQLGDRIRVVGGIGRLLGPGDVVGCPDEASKLGDGDRVLVDPEAVDGDPMNRSLLLIEVGGAHEELAPRDPAHALGRCAGVLQIVARSLHHGVKHKETTLHTCGRRHRSEPGRKPC